MPATERSPPEAPDAARPAVLGLSAREFAEVLGSALAEAGEPAYRLRQLEEWTYRRAPASFEEMSDLPRRLRALLAGRFELHPLALRAEQRSRDGTRKFLWARHQPGDIESVLIPDRGRITFCISTQAGCPVKCTFCATGHGGFQGQLSPAEIVDQVLAMWRGSGLAPTNLVFMGMGEPLLNFEAVLRSLEVLTEPRQLGFGARRITVSTVGVPERMVELGRRFPQVKLAFSLHAGRAELRDELVPLNRAFPLEDVLEALGEHTRLTGKLATVEYVVLPGVNDARRDAADVVRCLAGIRSRLNLIGFNPFAGAPYEKPPVARLIAFRQWLEAEGFPGPVTIRRSRGEDIEGACGQLSLARSRPDAAAS